MTDQTSFPEKEIEEIVKLFAGLDTPCVSDALDKIGINGQALGVMPLKDYSEVIIGPAFTVKYVPAAKPAGSVGDYIDDVKPGAVIVIDNDGRTDCTVWGDILTQYAGLHKIAGTVIDGVCRDVNKAIEDNYPVFSVGRYMRTGKDRVQVESVNKTVTVGTVRVEANDIVVADASGAVIVPKAHAPQVAKIAHEIELAEAAIRNFIASGDSLKQAREKLGYHTLQRKD